MVWIRGKTGTLLCVADGSAKSEFPGRRKRDAGRLLSMPRTGPPAWALTKRSDARISGESRPPEAPEKRPDAFFFAPGTASRRGWQSGKRGFGERREHWSGCCLSEGAPCLFQEMQGDGEERDSPPSPARSFRKEISAACAADWRARRSWPVSSVRNKDWCLCRSGHRASA